MLLVIIPAVFLTLKYARPTVAAWYDTNWLYRKQLSFNNSAQSSNLANFPVLVVLSSSNFDFTQAQNAGQDIRFTDSDGSTLLSYEIEGYDSVGQTARIWVKVPQINASSSTDSIYMYWGNAGAADAQSADNTWNSNYKGVYHLNNNAATTTVTDASGLGNDITASENTNNGFYQSAGKIGGGFLTGGSPTYITNQSGSNIAEVYPDIVLDSSGFPVIAYTDLTTYDLVLVHCNDKECKGGDETVSTVDSTGTTGYYPSLRLDGNGYPMIAYYYASGADLKYVHCNDVNCAGGNETFSVIETTNSTGYYPRMVLDAAGYPVIAYYYATGADLKIVHCGNANCNSGNVINTVDSGGTVGNGLHGTDLVLDSSGYPVMSYYDTTNTELKIAHCNDVNCSGADEAISSPLITLAKSLGIYTAIELDAGGLPMIAYYNATNLNLEFLHCDDANCAVDETANRIIVSAGVYDYYPSMEKNSSGIPVILLSRYGYIANAYLCANTNCSSGTMTYLALYNSQSIASNFKLDANNNIYVVTYSTGKTGDYDALLFTTDHKLERAYDSDFDFGTGSFSVSAWFKSNGQVKKNTLLSRYDADQGFKLELNYAGQACFGIDDDATWNPDDSVCSSNSQIITDVDNGHASGVSWNSMVLDSSGYPVIAYHDSGQLDLEIIHCNDANCTGNNENWASIDTAGDVGTEMSLILDAVGYPVISYHDNTNQDLKIVHCGNANCSSGNTINILDSGGDVGDFSTVKLDASGYPVISYYDATNTAVKLAHCNDINCSGADESIVTLVNDEDDRVQNGSESLQLDGSGYPIVAYFDNTNGDLKLIHCNDGNCDGVGETKTTVESTNWVGNYASMVLDSNGYPVIVHYDGNNLNPRLVHCGNVNCSAGNVASAINTINDASSGIWPLNIKLNGSGNPVILSYQPSSWSNILTVCNDVNCAGGNETNSSMREGTSYNYYYHSLTLDSNYYPVISYAANGSDLRLIHMTNGTTYTETGNYDDSAWHHLVAVRNGTSSITLYVDGVSVGSDTSLAATGTLTSNSASLNLAEEITNALAVNNWSGYLDEVQIDNTARSAAWVAAEYLSESNNFINTGITENGPTAVSLGTYAGDTGALKNNLVGYWKFDEGYSNIANNSGSGGSILNGNITNASWTNDGKFNKALNYDGTGDYTTIPNNSALNFGSNNFSVSYWLNFNPGSSQQRWTMGKGNPYQSSGAGWAIANWTTGNPITSTLYVSDGIGAPASHTVNFPSVNRGTWHQFTFVVDRAANLLKTYSNGVYYSQLDISSLGSFDSINDLLIGTGNGTGNTSDIKIDEVKIYNAALTADEVKMDYNRGSAMVLGSLSDTSLLSGGSVASNSASAAYCVPGGTDACSAPVAEWNFEEGSGNSANDSSGNSNALSLTSVNWSPGKYGKAGGYDGTNSSASISDNPSISLTNTGTLEAWVNPPHQYPSVNASTFYRNIINKWSSGGCAGTDEGYLLDWHGTNSAGTLRGNICNGTTTGGLSYSTSLPANTWSHISFTWDGSFYRLFLNGKIVAGPTAQSINNQDDTGTLRIGDGFGSGSSYRWDGKLDQVRIFNYARTPAQIAWDYNRGGPVGQWKFDECQGTVANDSSGNGNTGTISIGATGTNTSAGTCTDGLSTSAWYNGRTGKYNASLNFDGVDDTVTIGDPSSGVLDFGTNSFSYGLWVYVPSSAGPFDMPWYKGGSSAPNAGYDMELGTSSWQANISDGTTLKAVSFGTETLNQWVLLTVVVDKTNNKLYGYKNGILIGSGTDITGLGSVSNNVSAALSFSGYKFKGQIDDVRIYNYALTPAQIKMVYNNGAVNFGPVTGPP